MGKQVESETVETKPDPTSEAEQAVQEQEERGVSEETNQAPTSEAEQAVQEQPTDGQKSSIDEAEIRRRIEQSERDRIAHRIRMEMQQEMERQRKLEEEQRRLEEMDDEEFGQYVRQQQQEQARLAQIQQKVAMEQWATFHNQFLSTIEDADLRAELDARGQRGEFKSYAEFLKAAQDARLQKELEKRLAAELKRKEKELRDAILKEQTAEETESNPGPQLGSGTPTSFAQKMSTSELIATGFAEAIARQKKGK